MSRYVDIDKLRKNVKPWIDENVLVIPLYSIDEAETEDVTIVTHALWKSKNNNYYHYYIDNERYCSNCGESVEEPYMLNLGNYCPHCGSKMSIRVMYKGALCDFEWSKEDEVFFGKIIDDNNLITFENTDLLGTVKEFLKFVDEGEI